MGTVKIKINKQVVNKIEFAEYRALQATAKWLIKDIEKRNENLEGYFINTMGGGV